MAVSRPVAGLVVGVVVGLLALLAAPSDVRADPVTVRGVVLDGFARLSFDWPAPVAYSLAQDGDLLTIRFARPIEADLGAAAAALRPFVAAIVAEEDGRSLGVRLGGGADVLDFADGRTIAIDIIPREPLAAPATPTPAPATPAALAAAPAAPTVTLRSGEHEGFSRLVFDWPAPTPYDVAQDGSTVAIRFDRPGRIEAGALTRRPPATVRTLTVAPDRARPLVTLGVDPASRVRHFQTGNSLVVDVFAPPARAEAAPQAAPQPAPQPVRQPDPPPPAPQPTTPVSAPTQLTPPAPQEASAPVPVPVPVPQGPTLLVPVAPPVPGAPSSVPGPTPGPVPLAPPPDPGAPPLFTWQFEWDEPVAAAAFRRAGDLWIAFDKLAAPDLEALQAASDGMVAEIEQIESARATVLRIALPPEVNPTPVRDGLKWLFAFSRRVPTPQSVIDAQVNSGGQGVGEHLFLPVTEAGFAIPLPDPAVGDNLVVVPVIPLGYGVPTLRHYPEVDILPSIQGVVLRPRIDDLRVRPFRQGVELTAASGMNVSVQDAAADLAAQLGVAQTLARAFDLDVWRVGPLADYTKERQRLLYEISMAGGPEREKARINLARFYMANGFGVEAAGVLETALADNETLERSAEFRALRGASYFLMNRLEEALGDFQHESLERVDEAAFWAGAIETALGDGTQAAPIMRRTGVLIRPYPQSLKVKLGEQAVQAAIDIGDLRQAQHFLEVMTQDEPTPAQLGLINYIEGRVAELSGDFDGAIAKYEEAEDGVHRPSRARAIRDRAELLLRIERASIPETIEELERLRYAWRGDDFEFNLLRRLSELYFEIDDYRSGLRTLRQTATYFNDHPQAPDVTVEMSDRFRELYLDGRADVLPPVVAIALYDEFKELTPAGQDGDLMIRKLADRLIGVDLLDRAVVLLQNQVDFRLSGVEKAKTGAKLALVKMLDRDLEGALATLDATEDPGMSPELATTRRHLKARTLAELKRVERAAEVLTGDESHEANLIRAQMFWDAGDWPNATQALREIIRDAGARVGYELTELQQKYVLTLATALTLGGNERGVTRIRRDFGAAMERGRYADAFRLLATPPAGELMDYRTLREVVSEVESFQTFLADYRQRLARGELPGLE